MKPARDFVGVVVEFTARVKHRHDHFRGGTPFFRVLVHGNPAAIVCNRYRFIGMDRDLYATAMTRERLVYRVVHHLENHVMQAGAIIRVTDIHSRPFADGFQALENLDIRGVVTVFFCHLLYPNLNPNIIPSLTPFPVPRETL